MSEISIRRAVRSDAGVLSSALRQLSHDMGDIHRACDADIVAAGFGPVPAFHAILAEKAGHVVGAALYSPAYSTTWGMPGAYVSDLWVAAEARGQGLGTKLLARVRDDARADWGAGYLRLFVYRDNPRAAAFYARLGFVPKADDIQMMIEGAALDAVGGPR